MGEVGGKQKLGRLLLHYLQLTVLTQLLVSLYLCALPSKSCISNYIHFLICLSSLSLQLAHSLYSADTASTPLLHFSPRTAENKGNDCGIESKAHLAQYAARQWPTIIARGST